MGVLIAILAIGVMMFVLILINKGVDKAFRPLERRVRRADAARRLERPRKNAGN